MKKIISSLIISLLLFPNLSLAESDVKCSPKGYTIFTINGVFTNQTGAEDNKKALEAQMREILKIPSNQPLTYTNPKTNQQENIIIDYLHNPSHIGGLGDLIMSGWQKFRDDPIIQRVFNEQGSKDYDMIELWSKMSKKSLTQKMLMVSHSQGNFYTNSVYNSLLNTSGGISQGSMGVYGVASPAAYIPGEGRYLTSSTDEVIKWAQRLAPGKVLEANTTITLSDDEKSMVSMADGHDFSKVYLKYEAQKIIDDIKWSLDKLGEDSKQDPQKPCIDSPDITWTHKLWGAGLFVVDGVADYVVKPVVKGIFVDSPKIIEKTGELLATKVVLPPMRAMQYTGEWVGRTGQKTVKTVDGFFERAGAFIIDKASNVKNFFVDTIQNSRLGTAIREALDGVYKDKTDTEEKERNRVQLVREEKARNDALIAQQRESIAKPKPLPVVPTPKGPRKPTHYYNHSWLISMRTSPSLVYKRDTLVSDLRNKGIVLHEDVLKGFFPVTSSFFNRDAHLHTAAVHLANSIIVSVIQSVLQEQQWSAPTVQYLPQKTNSLTTTINNTTPLTTPPISSSENNKKSTVSAKPIVPEPQKISEKQVVQTALSISVPVKQPDYSPIKIPPTEPKKTTTPPIQKPHTPIVQSNTSSQQNNPPYRIEKVNETYQYPEQVTRSVPVQEYQSVREPVVIFKQVPKQITEYVTQTFQEMKQVPRTVYETVRSWVSTTVYETVSTIKRVARTVWDTVTRWVPEKVRTGWGRFMNWITQWVPREERTARTVYETITENTIRPVQRMIEKVSTVSRTVYDTITHTYQKVVPVIKTIWETVKEVSYQTVNKLVTVTKPVTETIWKTGNRIVEKLILLTR